MRAAKLVRSSMAPTSSAAQRAAAAPADGPPAPADARDERPPIFTGGLLDLANDVVALILSVATPASLEALRAACTACRDVHVPAAEQLAVERIGAIVEARGPATVAADTYHTLCVRPADGAALSCGGGKDHGDNTDLHLSLIHI